MGTTSERDTPPGPAGDQPTVARNDASGRYEISVDGAVVGFAEFSDSGSVRAMPHTLVDPAFSGRGLAAILVREALEDTRAAGLSVAPQCSYVAAFIDKNPEFRDLVA